MELSGGLYGFGLPFLVVLTVVVFVHELGHYFIARRNGVRVEVFSVGFGPELFGYTDKAGTRWKFSIIPLGGYVKMLGDANAASTPAGSLDEMSEDQKAVAFPFKPLPARAWIVAGGPLANFVFAIVLLAGLFSTVGQPFTPAVVGGVTPGSAAEQAGLLPGDRIVSIDGQSVERFEDLQQVIALQPEEELRVGVLRDEAELELIAIPERVVSTDIFGNEQVIGRLGVYRSGAEYVQHDPLTALWQATKESGVMTVRTLEAVGQIIVGKRSAEELGGPIRIAQMSGQAAEIGIITLVWFTAMLSINLGLINLFPVPMLDGGHLLYYGFEAVLGRPLGERAQEFGFRIGLALVLCLFVFVTWNDLMRIEVFEFVKDLVS